MSARPPSVSMATEVPARAVGLSGLGTRASRVTMGVVWLAFAAVVLQGGGIDATDLVALALLVPALWLSTSPVPEPIPLRLAWAVVLLAGTSAVIGIDPQRDTLFPMLALTGYLFAFMVIRGRAGLAIAAYLVTAVAVGSLAALRGETVALASLAAETFPQALWGPTSLLLALGWRAILLRSERQIGELELAQSASAVAEAQTRERIRAWTEHLADLTGDVDALLDRAAAGTLEPGDRELATRLEIRTRDRLRAPRLATPQLLTATEAARERGVTIVLLDDGDPGLALTAAQTAELLAHLDAAPAGARLTLRLNPPHRSVVGTVVLESGENLTRAVLLTPGADGGHAVT